MVDHLSLIVLHLLIQGARFVLADSCQLMSHLHGVTQVNVSEKSGAGTVLLELGTDSGFNFTTVPSGLQAHFTFTRVKGQVNLTLARALDLEFLVPTKIQGSEMSIVLKCSNDPSGSATVKINILPENDFAPEFINSPYNIVLKEHTLLGSEVFWLKDKVRDQDQIRYGKIASYSIEPYLIKELDGRSMFSVGASNGSIVLEQDLDFEALTIPYLFLNVTATDGGGWTKATTVNVTVLDIDDQPPIFVIPDCIDDFCQVQKGYLANIDTCLTGEIRGITPARIYAKDGDTLHVPVVYNITNVDPVEVWPIFQLNSTTGSLYLLSNLSDFKNDAVDGKSFIIEMNIQVTEEDDSRYSTNTSLRITVTVIEDFENCQKTIENTTVTMSTVTSKAITGTHDVRDASKTVGETNDKKTEDNTLVIKIAVPICACVALIVVMVIAICVCKGTRSSRVKKYVMKKKQEKAVNEQRETSFKNSAGLYDKDNDITPDDVHQSRDQSAEAEDAIPAYVNESEYSVVIKNKKVNTPGMSTENDEENKSARVDQMQLYAEINN